MRMVRRMDELQLQIDFHDRADGKRFENRIKNRFIRDKEIALTERIGRYLAAPGGTFLDVGAGEGSNCYFLKKAFPDLQISALDFSQAKVDFLEEHVPGVTPVCGNALSLPFPDQSFDTVLCRDLLHHVNWDRDGVLREARRVLKKGGVILVIESDGNKLLNRIFRLVFSAEKGMKDSTVKKLTALCSAHGALEKESLEASFLTRAVAFFLGNPEGAAGAPKSFIYSLTELYEKICAAVLPRDCWFYFMYVIRPGRG